VKKLIPILSLAIVLLCVGAQFAHAAEESGEFNLNEYIFGHVEDSYSWHITSWKDKDFEISLPCIVFGDAGPEVFMSSRLEEGGKSDKGYFLSQSKENKGKIVELSSDGTEHRPFDISITKNVLALIINSLVLLWIILATARWYRRHDVLKEAPTGIAAIMEPVVIAIEDDVIKPAVGDRYKKFSPYLLTAFFFILVNNLMGIIPFFPGGANVTGNIAITMVLALLTFIATNLFANKHYFKEVFWPDVPMFLKVIPIMPFVEFMGMFTKPFALMVRLFANILAGHILILSVISVIFITAKMGAVLNGTMSFVAVVFGVFMDCLELLVAFIQAYVFTMLSAVFIGLAYPEPEGEVNKEIKQ